MEELEVEKVIEVRKLKREIWSQVITPYFQVDQTWSEYSKVESVLDNIILNYSQSLSPIINTSKGCFYFSILKYF